LGPPLQQWIDIEVRQRYRQINLRHDGRRPSPSDQDDDDQQRYHPNNYGDELSGHRGERQRAGNLGQQRVHG